LIHNELETMTAQASGQEKNLMLRRHAVIIGGGISGLSAAFFLSQRAVQKKSPLKITILEASERFGGVLRTLISKGLQTEAAADAFYAGQGDATELCRELGLFEDVIEAAPCFRHFFGLKSKKPFSVPGFPRSFWEAIRFLTTSRVSFFTKCRMLGEPFVPRHKEESDESFASFIRRRFGEGFYQEIANPLVRGLYMMDPERISLGAMFPQFQQAERTHGSLFTSFFKKAFKRNENGPVKFFTLKQGLEGLAQALVRRLGECELRPSAAVRRCTYNRGWEILMEEGPPLQADILGLAMNACDASKLLPAAAPELSAALSNIRYDSIATVNFIYRIEDVPVRGLTPGFLISIAGERYPFSSLKYLGKDADGKNLLFRAFLSETMIPGILSENDETLKQKMQAFLNSSLGIRACPQFISVQRYSRALPQYAIGHLERVARIEEYAHQFPGLFLVGNGYRGFGITDCIRQARIATSRF